MGNTLLFVASGVIAVCVYCLVLISLVFTFFHSTPTHYASLRESTLSLNAISIEAIIDDKPLVAQNKPHTSNNPLAGSGIKNMFSQIDSDIPSRNAPVGDDREKLEQNAKEQKYKDLQAKTQEIQNKINALSNLTVSTNSNQSDGEYDPWYAEIEKMILSKWQKAFYTEDKLQALVHIRIADNGSFSYKVVKYSGNVEFDDSIQSMLDECTHISFPPHPKGKREIATTFRN